MATSHAALASAAAAGAASQAQERPFLSSGTRPPRIQPVGRPGEAPAPRNCLTSRWGFIELQATACAALQPLMYGAPFYSMPFTYPPASSTAQMPTEQSPGVATGLVEAKPSDADGEPKHDDDDSEPVSSASSLSSAGIWNNLPRSLLSILLAMSTSDVAYQIHSGT